jgi:hypothetical protein
VDTKVEKHETEMEMMEELSLLFRIFTSLRRRTMWKMSIPSITGYFFKAEISSWSHFGVVGVESGRVGSSRVDRISGSKMIPVV